MADDRGLLQGVRRQGRKRSGLRPRLLRGDAVVLQDAIERAGSTDKKKVRDALATTDISTFYGPIKFSANGMNQVRDLPIIQVQDKHIKVLAPADIKNGDWG